MNDVEKTIFSFLQTLEDMSVLDASETISRTFAEYAASLYDKSLDEEHLNYILNGMSKVVNGGISNNVKRFGTKQCRPRKRIIPMNNFLK